MLAAGRPLGWISLAGGSTPTAMRAAEMAVMRSSRITGLASARGAFDPDEQVVGLEGLGHVVVGAGRRAFADVGGERLRRHEDTGTAASSGSARRSRSRSRPLRFGIMMSVTTAAGRNRRAVRQAVLAVHGPATPCSPRARS